MMEVNNTEITDVFIKILNRGGLLATATVAFCDWFEVSGFRICKVPHPDENGHYLHIFPPCFDSRNSKRSTLFFTRAPGVNKEDIRRKAKILWIPLRDLILQAYEEALETKCTYYSMNKKKGYNNKKESLELPPEEDRISDEDFDRIDKEIPF